MTPTQTRAALHKGRYDRSLKALYGETERERWDELLGQFTRRFEDTGDVRLFSAPGRTELSGNHTDHNHGRVLAASICLDSVAAVAKNGLSRIRLHSQGFTGIFEIDIQNGLEPLAEERGTAQAILRGMTDGFAQRGHRVGGFDAVVSSRVKVGSGLSSSASFEVLIGAIINGLFNDGSVSSVEIARIGQEAENRHFGKPCGLMDQLACAHGGVIGIDFTDAQHPRLTPVRAEFSGYDLVVVDTGSDHADLTEEYASVPAEMKSVAAALGKTVLSETRLAELLEAVGQIRTATGDRALLRALHFHEENRRVAAQIKALGQGDIEGFLRDVRASGSSSWRWLQNTIVCGQRREQSVALALALAEIFLGERGAVRVHGGGFAGTILAFVPSGRTQEFCERMQSVFGSAERLSIRQTGLTEIGSS